MNARYLQWSVYAMLVFMLASISTTASAETCGGVFHGVVALTPIEEECESANGVVFCGATTLGNNTVCNGFHTSGVTYANTVVAPDGRCDGDDICFGWTWVTLDPLPPECSFDPVSGLQLCPGTPSGPDCASTSGQSNFYSCTRSTLADAQLCAEGGVTPEGCELETTVDPAAPECTQSGTPISQGGSGTEWTCVVDLTSTGAEAPFGHGLPQVDSDDPTTSETGDTTESSGTDETGCDFTSITNTTLTNNGDGTLTRCSETITTKMGGSCPEAGTTTEISCNTEYSDGSSTSTDSTTSTDSQGNPTGGTSNTTNNPPSSAGSGEGQGGGEEDNGQYSGGLDCTAPPTCSGDVLQCGIIEQTWQQRCDFVDSVDDFNPDAGGLEVATDEVDVESEVDAILATDGWIADRSCPTVPPVTVGGTSVEWSFEGICQAFDIMSYLVLAFAGFASIRVFMGAF